MEQLAIYSHDISTPEGLAALRLDSSVPHYRSIPEKERKIALMQLVGEMYTLKHATPTIENATLKEVVKMDTEALDRFILDDIHVSDFTFPEIKEAFQKGLLGYFGEYYGLNPVTFFGFLRDFLHSPKKLEAIRIVRRRKEQARKERFLKEQKDRARMEAWGVPMKTVTWEELQKLGTPETIRK